MTDFTLNDAKIYSVHDVDLLVNLFLLIHTQSARSHIDKQQKPSNNRQSLEKVVPKLTPFWDILEEIPMRMSRLNTPEIINQDIENTQQCNKEHG